MKTLGLVVALVIASLSLTSQAHAGSVGKVAGNYTGSGVLIDKRSSPISTYQYSFADMKIKVKKNGKISGTAIVTVSVSSSGSAFLPITTTPVSATGAVTNLETSGGKIKGAGTVTFSDGTTVMGNFSVAAKTGKGSFKVKDSTTEFDANFKVSKKK
jgi:hypothetical protein